MHDLKVNEAHTTITDTTANPAPLGLMGFGMTTVLLNIHNAGLIPLDTMILAMGIFYGGIAQVIAGLLEWKKGNTFGTTAFTSYGLFWLSLVALLLMSHHGLYTPHATYGMVAYFLMWALFTGFLFIGTLHLNRALQFVFASLTLLFLLLALRDVLAAQNLTAAHNIVARITGYEGIFCGLTAVYTAFALVLNETCNKTLLPIGPVAA